jgi:hypothetical protein
VDRAAVRAVPGEGEVLKCSEILGARLAKESLATSMKDEKEDTGHAPPANSMDLVIEAYKKDIDRTLLRESLKLTVEERLDNLAQLQRFLEEMREAGRRVR